MKISEATTPLLHSRIEDNKLLPHECVESLLSQLFHQTSRAQLTVIELCLKFMQEPISELHKWVVKRDQSAIKQFMQKPTPKLNGWVVNHLVPIRFIDLQLYQLIE